MYIYIVYTVYIYNHIYRHIYIYVYMYTYYKYIYTSLTSSWFPLPPSLSSQHGSIAAYPKFSRLTI